MCWRPTLSLPVPLVSMEGKEEKRCLQNENLFWSKCRLECNKQPKLNARVKEPLWVLQRFVSRGKRKPGLPMER